MDRIQKRALELIEEAFSSASERRWVALKAEQDERERLAILREEDAATAAKRRLLSIIGTEDALDG